MWKLDMVNFKNNFNTLSNMVNFKNNFNTLSNIFFLFRYKFGWYYWVLRPPANYAQIDFPSVCWVAEFKYSIYCAK